MSSIRERHQHLERSQIELTDQHGRIWYATTEVGRNFHGQPRIVPVGQYFPQFAAPFDFIPPQAFLVYDPRRPSLLSINYAGWQEAQEARHREVAEQLAALAWHIYKDEAPKYIKAPSQEMLDIVYGRGKGPEPIEPIVAARQGNGWILGLRPFDPALPGDVRLKPFMERWVQARYRHITLLDAQGRAADELDFTEGQAGDSPAEAFDDSAYGDFAGDEPVTTGRIPADEEQED